MNPKIALISAGRENRFGHPHSDVIERFTNRNISLLRTDESGAVRLFLNRERLKIETVLVRKKQDEP
jgi:competence protein ComEC